MYLPVSRVKVIESSSSKRKSSIKRGTVGYVANLGGMYTRHVFNRGKEFVFTPGYLIVVKPDSKGIEQKPVIYAAPLERVIGFAIYLLRPELVVKKASKFKGILMETWRRENVKIHNPPVIVAVPSKETVNLIDNDQELKAWIISFFKSGLLIDVLSYEENGESKALSEKLMEFLPPKDEIPWHKLFIHIKELIKVIDTLTREEKLRFINFLQGQRSINIRNFLAKKEETIIKGLDLLGEDDKFLLKWIEACYKLKLKEQLPFKSNRMIDWVNTNAIKEL